MPRPDCRSRPAKDTPQASMPWRFPQTACTWRLEDSTVACVCTQRKTARWNTASCRYRWTEVRNDVAVVAVDCVGVDRVGVEPFRAAGDHRIAAARSAEGQALHADAGRQESR